MEIYSKIMNTYVFVTRSICGMGGGYQYISNKAAFLHNKGWRILVFSGLNQPVFLKEFKQYEKYIYPTLLFTPYLFRKKESEATIKSIVAAIGDIHGDECIIESEWAISAVWAELIASQLKCRHIAYILQEKHHYDNEMKKFLSFKFNRHELAGISKISVQQILGDKTLEQRADAQISAFCNNVFEDVEDNYSVLLKNNVDYNIGSLGRLEKPCVPAIVEGLCLYAKKNPHRRFNFIFIGASTLVGREEWIREKVKPLDNVNLVITGNVFPIPTSFINKIDVFVSTAGSANATYLAGRPTVKVTPSGEPLGIIGFDYEFPEKNMYASVPGMTIEQCIDRALNNRRKIVLANVLGDDYKRRMNKEFERQLSLAMNKVHLDYYDESRLANLKCPMVKFPTIRRCLGHLFGSNQLQRFARMFGRVG